MGKLLTFFSNINNLKSLYGICFFISLFKGLDFFKVFAVQQINKKSYFFSCF